MRGKKIVPLLLLVVSAVLHLVESGVDAPGRQVSSLAKALNLSRKDNFVPGKKAHKKTSRGTVRQRLLQTYNGLQVVGVVASVELDSDDNIVGDVSGDVASGLDIAVPYVTAWQRTREELLNVALAYLGAGKVPSDVKQVKKVLVEGIEASLVYELSFVTDADSPLPRRPFFVIDAATLNVIKFFDRMNVLVPEQWKPHFYTGTTNTKRDSALPATVACPSNAPAVGYGGNARTGRRVYGVDSPFCLYTAVSNSTCIMDIPNAKVIDLQGASDTGSRTAVEFDCVVGYNDAVNEAYGVANDALHFGDTFGRLFPDWFGITALDIQPVFRVHYRKVSDQDYCNAFWDGKMMTFGDGCEHFYPLVSLDVVTHEMAHGISDRYSKLYFTAESGGISEAFSDISGEIAEFYNLGVNDWMVGADIIKNAGYAIRYFADPAKDCYLISSFNDYYEGLDVHYSSGIFNKAFWNLVTVQGMPMREAYELMLYANQVFWGETTTFLQGACGAFKAAHDLGLDLSKVTAAFASVDLDVTSASCGSKTTTTCTKGNKNCKGTKTTGKGG